MKLEEEGEQEETLDKLFAGSWRNEEQMAAVRDAAGRGRGHGDFGQPLWFRQVWVGSELGRRR